MFGQGFRLLQDSAGGWHTTDEQFWKIDQGPATDNTLTEPVTYQWRIITPDGTKYFFGTAADQTDYMVYWNFVLGSQFANRFMLSRVVDPNQNLITVSYARLTKNVFCGAGAGGAMTPAVYPTQIRYGGQGSASLPYAVVFNRSGTPPSPLSGATGTDRQDLNVDGWINDGCTQPAFDTNALASLDVTVGGQLARRYVFTTLHYAVPLLLASVDRWGDAAGAARERLLTVTYTPVLQNTDTPVTPGSGPAVTGSYRLLQGVTNAFGATTSFGYQFEGVANFAGYEGPGTNEVLYNGRTVVATSATVDPGFGGATRATNYGGYTNAQGNGDVNWPDFLGHAQVTATDAAASTVSSFLQGQSPGRLTQATVSDLASPPNVLRQTTQQWSAQHLDPNATGITWTSLTQRDVTQQAATKRETYAYTTTNQNGGQYGNLTDRYEYDLEQSPTAWLRHTNRWFYPGTVADHYVVNRLAQENVFSYDGSADGAVQRSTLSCYDGATNYATPIGGAGTDGSYRGRRTALRRNADLPNTDQYVDVTAGYDQWGNQTTQTRWNSYGTATQLASSDGRTTTTAYDGIYHAYKVGVTTPPTPTVPGGLVTQYGWDVVHSRQTSVTDPNNQTTTHAYDGLGRRAATWLPGDDPGQPGAATVTYRYLVGGGQPAGVQVGRRKDAGGGAFGPRAYTWQHYDGTGRLLQTQRDYRRPPVLIRAQDVNDLLSALTADGGTAPFSPVGAGTSVILASHFTQLQAAIQALWATPPGPVPALGTTPGWSGGATPAGGPNPTPIYLSNLVDLRAWLNAYELWFNAYRQNLAPLTVHGWSNSAGTVVVVNHVYDNRGLLQRQSVPHLLTLNVPGQFQAGDWASTSTPATTSTYDGVQRPLTRVQPDRAATFRWAYNGWAVTLVDENNHQKVRTTDALGRLATVQDFTGTYPAASLFQTTNYAYSTADQLTTVTDATGKNVTSRVYDSVGRLTSQVDPDLGTWTYVYNPIGTLASRTDAKDQTLNYSYDLLDRLTSKSGAGLSVGYGYDSGGSYGLGRRTSLADAAGAASYGYDARGRLTSLTRTINGSSYSLGTTYDEQDRVLTNSYPNGDALAYAYGDDGRPTTLTLGGASLVGGAAYNALGQPTSLPLGNGLVTAWRYYALDQAPPQPNQWYGRLYSVQTGGVQSQTMTSYDMVGNPTGIGYGDHTAEAFAAGYDEWDQLTSYGSLEGYSYLAGSPSANIGTLQTKGADAYTYPAPGQPVPHAPSTVQPAGQSYSYDQNGNRDNNALYYYTYDAENHLTELNNDGLPEIQNAYDGDGRRLVRTLPSGTTHAVGAWYEADPTTGVGTTYYPFNGTPVAMKQGDTLSYLYHDHLGSLVGATDASGNELGWARYLPFGGLRLSGGSLPTDRLFTGQTRDFGDQFYSFKARYYDAAIGQFHSPDGAAPDLAKGGPTDPQALNRYAYALNKPLRLTDPSGHDTLDPAWVQQFESAHGGRAPTEQDWNDYQFTLGHPGTGPSGAWTDLDWSLFSSLQQHVGISLAEAAWPAVANGEQRISSVTVGNSLDRSPDYTTLVINVNPPNPLTDTFVGFTFGLTRDFYGRWYFALGGNVGKAPTAISGSLVSGWISVNPGRPNPTYLHDFLVQLSIGVGVGVGAGLGGGVMWGNVLQWGLQNWSKENGPYFPWQAGLSATWAWDVPFQSYPF